MSLLKTDLVYRVISLTDHRHNFTGEMDTILWLVRLLLYEETLSEYFVKYGLIFVYHKNSFVP